MPLGHTRPTLAHPRTLTDGVWCRETPLRQTLNRCEHDRALAAPGGSWASELKSGSSWSSTVRKACYTGQAVAFLVRARGKSPVAASLRCDIVWCERLEAIRKFLIHNLQDAGFRIVGTDVTCAPLYTRSARTLRSTVEVACEDRFVIDVVCLFRR